MARPRVHAGKLAGLAAAILRADAFTFGDRIFLSRESGRTLARDPSAAEALLAHELVHVEQFRRHGTPRFLFLYLREYVLGRWQGRRHTEAYAAISFEREARERADDRARSEAS